jgi:thioesterase domain-containing protein/acyl carrier protein
VEAREGEGYAAPATPPERALVRLWEEVLAVAPVGMDDDFFALGGHSMLAVRLMTRIRRELGAELPLSALFERPTIRRLAGLLDAAPEPRAGSPLVALQPAGDRVPLFFVHPIGGQVLCYSNLSRALGPDQPFYGLQAADLTQVVDESLEDMAARYVEAIRTVWPRGPYLLGGWSFGGLVAFEIAQQLTRAGEWVALVAILDTAAPRAMREMADVGEPVLLATLAHEEAVKNRVELSLTAEELEPLDSAARVARTLDALVEAGALPPDVEVEWIQRFLEGHRVRNEAMARYTPTVYPGRLVLFRASEQLAGFESRGEWSDPAGWRPYTLQPLLVETIPGYHATLPIGPEAAVVAKRLRAAIDDVLSSP